MAFLIILNQNAIKEVNTMIKFNFTTIIIIDNFMHMNLI